MIHYTCGSGVLVSLMICRSREQLKPSSEVSEKKEEEMASTRPAGFAAGKNLASI